MSLSLSTASGMFDINILMMRVMFVCVTATDYESQYVIQHLCFNSRLYNSVVHNSLLLMLHV